jgi:hypothetical protein
MAIERLTQVLHRTKMNQADQALCAPQFPFFSERLLRMLEPSAHNGKPPGTKRNTAHLGKGNQQPCQHALETNNPMQGFSAVCGCVVHCGPIHPLRTLEACVQSPSIFLKKSFAGGKRTNQTHSIQDNSECRTQSSFACIKDGLPVPI